MNKLIVPLLLILGSHCAHYSVEAQIAGPNDSAKMAGSQPQLVVQLGHSAAITSVAFSKDGRFILTGGDDGSAYLWDSLTGSEIREFVGHKGRLNSIALSSDGRFVVTGSADGSARIWNVNTAEETRRFKGTVAVLSPDGRFVLTGYDGRLYLYEIATGAQVQQFTANQSGRILSLAYSLDGNFALTGNTDGTARLWNATTGQLVRNFEGHDTPVTTVSLSPDAHFILTGEWETVRLRNAITGKEIRRFENKEHIGHVNAVALSPDGRFVLTARDDALGVLADLCLWDIESGKEIRKFSPSDRVLSIEFSPDGRFILTGSIDRTARLWNAATGKEYQRLGGNSSYVWSASYSSDGRFILSGGDRTAYLWDTNLGREIQRFEEDLDSKDQMALTDSTRLSPQGLLSRLPILTGVSIAFSPDGRFILTGSNVGTAHLWDATTGKSLWRVESLSKSINSVAFSPDGQSVALGGGSFSLNRNTLFNTDQSFADIELLDANTGKRTKILSGHSDFGGNDLWASVSIRSLAFSPGGRFILGGSGSYFPPRGIAAPVLTGEFAGSVRLWSVSSGREVWRSKQSTIIDSVAFAPESKGKLAKSGDEIEFIAAGGDNGRAGILSPVVSENGDTHEKVEDDAGIHPLCCYRHSGSVLAVSFSPNFETDEYFLTGSADMTARLWKTGSLREIRRFEGHSDWVHSVAFSPDSRFVLTGSKDGTTRVWNAATGQELCRLISFRDGNWVIVATDGRFDTNNLEEIRGLRWVMADEPLRPLPLEIFMRDYYEPGLLPRLLKCTGDKEHPCDKGFKPVRDISRLNRVQPSVKIGKVSLPDAEGFVNVAVEVAKGEGKYLIKDKETTDTTGVYDLRLFRDGQMVGAWPKDGAEKLVELRTKNAIADAKLGDEAKLAKELREWRDASQIRPGEATKADPKTGKMTLNFRVRLPHGKDASQIEFTAYAFNEDRVKSETAGWTWPDELKAHLPKPQPVKRRAYIISVGVNASQVEQWQLDYAANDARLMNDTLTEQLKHGGDYEVVAVLLEADDESINGKIVSVRDASKAKIHAVLDLLAGKQVSDELRQSIPNYKDIKQATPDDLVLLSFSSHGYADRNGDFFILPYDVRGGGGSALPDLQSCISSDELSLWLRDVDAGEMVMIVDACHAAAAVQGSGFKPGPMGSRGLGQLSYDKGMRILTATQAADVALEVGGQIGQGLLSYALVQEGLRNKKADFKPRDGVIGMREWLDYGVTDVPELYKQITSGELRTVGRGTKVSGNSGQQLPSLFDFARKRPDVTLMKLSTQN